MLGLKKKGDMERIMFKPHIKSKHHQDDEACRSTHDREVLQSGGGYGEPYGHTSYHEHPILEPSEEEVTTAIFEGQVTW